MRKPAKFKTAKWALKKRRFRLFSGRFTAASLGETANRTYGAAVADIDRDGDLDVILSNDLPERKLIFKNDGKGRFIAAGSWGEAIGQLAM